MTTKVKSLIVLIVLLMIGGAGFAFFGKQFQAPPSTPSPSVEPTPQEPTPPEEPKVTDTLTIQDCDHVTPATIKVVQGTDITIINNDKDPHWIAWDPKNPEVGFWVGEKSSFITKAPAAGNYTLGCDKNSGAVEVTVVEKL